MPTIEEVFLNANSNIRIIDTVTITHSEMTTRYLSNQEKPFEGKLENGSLQIFEPYGFSIKLPDESIKGQSNAQFVVDATEKAAIDDYQAFLDSDSTEPIMLDYRMYITGSTEIQKSILNMKLMDTQLDYNKISGAGSRPDIVNRMANNRRYDATVLKGLNYV